MNGLWIEVSFVLLDLFMCIEVLVRYKLLLQIILIFAVEACPLLKLACVESRTKVSCLVVFQRHLTIVVDDTSDH